MRLRDGFKITVELGSVNRRQSEISVNLPRELELLEAQVRDAINAQVARGRVTARIGIHAADGQSSARAHINLPLAKSYATELARLAKSLKISGEVSLDQILRAPGVFQSDEELVEAETIWPVIEKALKQSLAALVKMREREGAHLAEDLTARIGMHARKPLKKFRSRCRRRRRITGKVCLNESRTRALKTLRRMTKDF